MLITYATRTNHLKAKGAYAALAKAQALEADGRNIIHFEIGQLNFDTFANISKAGMEAIKNRLLLLLQITNIVATPSTMP